MRPEQAAIELHNNMNTIHEGESISASLSVALRLKEDISREFECEPSLSEQGEHFRSAIREIFRSEVSAAKVAFESGVALASVYRLWHSGVRGRRELAVKIIDAMNPQLGKEIEALHLFGYSTMKRERGKFIKEQLGTTSVIQAKKELLRRTGEADLDRAINDGYSVGSVKFYRIALALGGCKDIYEHWGFFPQEDNLCDRVVRLCSERYFKDFVARSEKDEQNEKLQQPELSNPELSLILLVELLVIDNIKTLRMKGDFHDPGRQLISKFEEAVR